MSTHKKVNSMGSTGHKGNSGNVNNGMAIFTGKPMEYIKVSTGIESTSTRKMSTKND